ncbi:MAG: flagellar assembly protein FliW [Gracilibacteraceae bacterium]|nr:flagellar assembly protein FliW [Gracilibacteraceae bacterium]
MRGADTDALAETIQIKTADYGEIEVKRDSILHFAGGLFAFEDERDFVIINYEFAAPDSPIKCLQSVSGTVSFTIMDPFCFLPDYSPVLPEQEKKDLGCADEADLRYFVIAVVSRPIQNTVVNLLCPIVINTKNRRAAQVILENPQYPMQYRIFASEEVT